MNKKPCLVLSLGVFMGLFVFIFSPSSITELWRAGNKGTNQANLENQETDKQYDHNEDEVEDQSWLEKQEKLYNLNEKEMDSVLKEINARWNNKKEKLYAFSFLRLGTPYQIGGLGEESGIDKDPVFRLDITDCSSFILTNTTLLNSQNLESAREIMKFIHYRPNKEISFENRLHFTTHRNTVSPYFNDITEQIAGKDKVIEKTVILNKINENGKRLININWEKEMIIKYIPNLYINQELFDKLPKVVGIAFIKKQNFDIGLDVSHEGLLFDAQTLFHASSIKKQIVAENFLDYYFGEAESAPKFDGIILFEIK